jgi:hypothetical protein
MIGDGVQPDSGSLARSRWDDKSFPATLTKLGSNDKPGFDFTELGLLFPQNDTSEKVYIVDQMLHAKKFGSPIDLHLHYIQTTSDLPIFKAEYRFYNNGDAVPATWTTISTEDGGVKFPYTSGSIMQISKRFLRKP